MLNDRRDTIMLSTIMNMVLVTGALEAALWWHPSHLAGLAVHVCNLLLFAERFILMLHYSAHLPIFKPRFAPLNHFLQVVAAPFYGLPMGMYHAHHVVMHHIENNVFPSDLSTTEPYQRDSPSHFLVYWLKYWASVVLLPLYALRKRRYASHIRKHFWKVSTPSKNLRSCCLW